MKVILQQDLKEHGKKGQVIDVSDGFARNYLIPRKLAVEATPDRINALKVQEKARLKRLEAEKSEALSLAERLNALVVRVKAKAGAGGRLFGAVTAKEISDALLEQHGISIEKNRIALDEHIKSYGSYEIRCKLGHEVSGVIHLIVTED